jgi:hypothetical protein
VEKHENSSQIGDCLMRTNIEMEWEHGPGLQELEDEALELEQLPLHLYETETPFGSWRVRGTRPTPQYLRFLNIDQFIWNKPTSADPRALKASLTARHWEMIERLAKHVRLSWKTMRPIAYIRLIGHTDNTGVEKYNLELGNWRAQAVKKALEELLTEDIRERRIRIAIIVEESPGSAATTADNRTTLARALNRRVEVFVAPPEPPPEPKPPPPWPPEPPEPPESVIKTKPGPWWPPLPPGSPGKSLKDWINGKMKDLGVPGSLRDPIWQAISDKDWGLLNFLLGKAGVAGADKDMITGAAQALSQAKAR